MVESSKAVKPWREAVHAAKIADWEQVILNGGPPCFKLMRDGKFCFRAERWQGHGVDHKYTSLEDLLRCLR